MTDAPKIKPYAVAMVFGAPPTGLICNAVVGATSPEMAAASGLFMQLQTTPHLLEHALSGVAVMALEERLVRAMHAGLEGKTGEVVQLHAVEARPLPAGDVRLLTPEELAKMPPYTQEPSPPEDAA